MNPSNPTILILDNSPSITGAYNSIVNATTMLSKQFNFYFALSSTNLADDRSKNGFYSAHIPFLEVQKNWKIIFYFPFLLLNTYRLIKIINKHSVGVVHVNDLYNMCGVLLKIFKPSLKLVYHIRLLPNSYAQQLYALWKRLIELFADEIICVSQVVASHFCKEKTTVIYDTLTPKQPENYTKKESVDTLTILYLANYVDGKGHEKAIEAYYLAFRKIPVSKLIFYGGTLGKEKNLQFKNSLIRYAEKLGVSNHIQFYEFTSNTPDEITKADIMLNFSASESFSMTTLEALIYGTPIIATACGGPSEIIEDGKSGFLVPIHDIKAMSQAIETLANKPELRKSFVREGRKRVISKFDTAIQVEILRSLYVRLLCPEQKN